MPPTFAALGVPAPLCARLEELGITEPFPVQAATLPDGLAGRDVCGKAPTGSGKTIAFGLPMLARIERAAPRRPKGLVLVPTRELASQVQEQLQALCWGTKTEVLAVYGGAGMDKQMRALGKGVEIVVATPGRLKDLLDRGSLRLDEVNLVVIDEADRMADMGFLPEVRRLLDQTHPKRQTMLFSATLDGDVDVLIRSYQTNPVHHEAHSMEEQGEVTHRFWAVSHADRIQVATAIVERSWPAIVFSRTRHGAERLSKQLRKAGIRAEAIHGDRSQSQRERALAQFGRGDVHVLVATDVAARGIHVDGVACVLQFDPPATDKDYVHRSGRTGRAGDAGTVITFVPPEKEKDVRKMQRELRRREPIEAATVATAASVLASSPPKPIDRGDDLDGVSRRDQPRANVDRVADLGRAGAGPRRKPKHRKGTSPRQVAEADWTPRAKPGKPAASKGRNGQERAGAPARSGRPGAKPGRRPAGAGAARQGRPASGNARRRSR
jgi:superfamily II DNA/RNA helicase